MLSGAEIDTIVLSSGGPKAFPAFIAVLQELVSARRLRLGNLRRCQGTSAGAVMALCLALRLPFSEILRCFDESLREASAISLAPETIFSTLGAIDASLAETGVSRLLAKGEVPSNATFGMLADMHPFDLVVVATNVNDGSAVAFSASLTPSVRVLDAVVASMSIPFVFPPRRILVDEKPVLCVDGAVADPLPLGFVAGVPKCNSQKTLAVRVCCATTSIQADAGVNALTYASHIISLMLTKIEQCETRGFVVVNVALPSSTSFVKLTPQQRSTSVAIATTTAIEATALIEPIGGARSIGTQTSPVKNLVHGNQSRSNERD
tara:strand:+ start:42591 stop:43553 length:963 start_codon:yes stop_codon:yes gene_type:complete